MNHTSEISLPADTPDFIVTRVIDAPRPLIWTCWTDAIHVARWWGPKPFTCPVCDIDARVGGRFHIKIRSSDGTEYPMSGTFLELIPHERIVKEDDVSEHSGEWHEMVDPGRVGQGKRKIDMTTTVSFEDHGKGTKLTISTRFPSIALRDNFARIGTREAWCSSLERLEELTAALKDSDREFNIVRIISAPLAKVYTAFSDPKGLAQWWGPNGFTTTTHKMDFQVGGTWVYTMHGPDGTDYPNLVTYTAIEQGRCIAYDHGTDEDHPAMFKAVISFQPQGERTKVTLRLILANASERPTYISFGAVEGGYQNLERLDAYINAQH